MHRQKPKRFPHRNNYVYTQRGFRQRLKPRFLREGWRPCDVERLERIYFNIGLHDYLDQTGAYSNLRKHRLYYMARELHTDRKSSIFDLVIRSEMFDCYFDDAGRLVRFGPPRPPRPPDPQTPRPPSIPPHRGEVL